MPSIIGGIYINNVMKLITKIFLITIFTANIIYSQNDVLLSDNGITPIVEIDQSGNYHFLWQERYSSVHYACYSSEFELINSISPFPNTENTSDVLSISVKDTIISLCWIEGYDHDANLHFKLIKKNSSENVNEVFLPIFHYDTEPCADGKKINDTLYMASWNDYSPEPGIYAQTWNCKTDQKSDIVNISNLDFDFGTNLYAFITPIPDYDRVLICWRPRQSDFIYGRIIDINLKPLTESFVILESESAYIGSSIRSAKNSKNEIVISWINNNYYDEFNGWERAIQWRWLDYDGKFLTQVENIMIDENRIANYYDLDLTIDKDDKLVLVWNDKSDGFYQLYGQRYLNNNTKFEKDFRISLKTRNINQYYPRIDIYNNKVITAWWEPNFNAEEQKLYFNTFDFFDPTLNFRELVKFVNLDRNYVKNENILISVNTYWNDDFTIFAEIRDSDSTLVDRIKLNNIGENGDELANDSTFSVYYYPPENIEDYYTINLNIAVNEFDTVYYTITNSGQFATVGPLTINNFEILEPDSSIQPGDFIRFKLELKNNSNYQTVNNISVIISTNDSSIFSIYRSINAFGDIEAQSIGLPNNDFVVRLSEEAKFNYDIPFTVTIYSNNIPYWNAEFTLHIDELTDIENDNSQLLDKFELYHNYPNPFNPITTIKYQLPAKVKSEKSNVASDFSLRKVTLKVYDLLGREVATLVNQKQNPGNYSVQFDGSNLPSGIYYYQIKVGNFVNTKKMVLLK